MPAKEGAMKKKELGRALSERLKALREAKGLSQQELATGADLSMSLVAKLEQGKKADPRVSTVLALASTLGVGPGAMLDNLVPAGEAAGEESGPAEEAPASSDDGAGAGRKKKKGGKKRKAKRR
jgi:transcriptional regulator with XRE-family HTH domain